MTAATTTPTLTAASLALFLEYANDAGNWGGTPLVGGNVTMDAAAKGNLTDLKKNGLLTTFREDGEMWINFTAAGLELLRSHGVVTSWLREATS
jgi:hypothetical protein